MQKHAIARAVAGARWNPRDGLIGSDQGLWLDPSDLTTMFQDSAGTTPVTAVEQPVGLIRDKSGRNNHAFQSTSANRPTLSARYNLLTKTEQFDDAAWFKARGGIAANQSVSGLSVDKITANETNVNGVYVSFGWTIQGQTPISVSSGTVYKFSAYAYKGSRDCFVFHAGNGSFSNYVSVAYNINSGTFLSSSITGSGWSVVGTPSISAISANSGWYLISFSVQTAGTELALRCYPSVTSAADLTCTGGVDFGYLHAFDIRPADQAALPYQRVNTATDYDSDRTKFPRRINYAAGQSMTVSFPANLGSSCVVARANPGVSAVISENQTVNTPLTLNTSHSGLVITSRSISVDEKTRLDEYLDKKAIAK